MNGQNGFCAWLVSIPDASLLCFGTLLLQCGFLLGSKGNVNMNSINP